VSAPDVFDELLSLRRLEVALKRGDDRMFEQGLGRLNAEIGARQVFKHHQAWQALLGAATDSEKLPDGLKDSLREAISRLIAVEARVAPAAEPASDAEAPETSDARPIALVLGWHTSLRDPSRRNDLLSWLARSGGRTAGAQALEAALRDEGLTLEQLMNRANVTLAAAHAGVATQDAPWVDTFLAGLSRVLGEAPAPPVAKLTEAIAPLGPVSLLVAEPSLAWETFYGPQRFRLGPGGPAGRMALAKLAGSIDRFYCHACYALTESGPTGGAQALVIACPGCGAPARPLVVPTNSPHFMPPALREQWAWGASLLREAATWVLVNPPAPAGDAFERWLLAELAADTRVVVLSEDDAVLKAWQDRLADAGAGAVVTSHGSPDDVLAFLLQGGVPELQSPPASASPPRPTPAAFAKKKLAKR
jgi:hypothetical protein